MTKSMPYTGSDSWMLGTRYMIPSAPIGAKFRLEARFEARFAIRSLTRRAPRNLTSTAAHPGS